MKEQIKTPEKELSNKEIANPSDAEFKTLVIGMFKELSEYSNKINKTKEEMKVTLSELKKNLQETNSGVNESQIQINGLEQKEKISIQLEQREETGIQKNEERLRNLWDHFKHSNMRIIGVPEGEDREKEIGNLFEKNNKKNSLIW